MNKEVKKAVVRAARYGMTIVETALWFCMNKDKISQKQYYAFCDWIKENERFYYWLRARLNSAYAVLM